MYPIVKGALNPFCVVLCYTVRSRISEWKHEGWERIWIGRGFLGVHETGLATGLANANPVDN